MTTSVFNSTVWAREVHLVGLGGIGSWVALQLMKLGVPVLHVYDDDVVELHNVSCQNYRKSDVGELKVAATAAVAEREETTTQVIQHTDRVLDTSNVEFRGVVISGVDSMGSRWHIWQKLAFKGKVELYMDGRIGGDDFQLYTLNPSDPSQVEFYESWLYTDEEATPAPCSVRDDSHAATALVGFITKNLTSFARGERPQIVFHGDMSVVAAPGGATPVVQIP